MFPATVDPSPPPWPQGLNPQRAPVKPRVRSSQGGEALPLEDHVIALLQSKVRGVVSIFGPAGSGKTIALRHLAAVLGPREDLCFADNRYPAWVDAAAERSLVLFTSRDRRDESIHAFEMSPWTQDEIIEYLLAVHREQCSSVMADLRGASFHLGATRSGLVPGGGIPSEGTRTGFYTDDYDEHRHRPPEQIRHANLRGADLIGARVEETDFYLVDLRDAQYTEEQHDHFRRCGAIL